MSRCAEGSGECAGVGWPSAQALDMGSLRDNLEGMQAAAAHHAAHHRDSDGEELDDSIMILGTTPQARSALSRGLLLGFAGSFLWAVSLELRLTWPGAGQGIAVPGSALQACIARG